MRHDAAGFDLIWTWIWEHLLRNTTGFELMDVFEKHLAFSVGTRWLRQMVLGRDLCNLHGDRTLTTIDIETALRFLHNLDGSGRLSRNHRLKLLTSFETTHRLDEI